MEFDYIVVGGGSAGCVVAGELAADKNVRVLVLEVGPAAEENPETLVAAEYKYAFINEQLMHDRVSVPQAGCAGNRLFMGSGRGSGGSGSINAMVYTRGDRQDFDEWRCPGWSWDELCPAFTAVEQRLNIHRLPPTRFTETCISAAEQASFARKEDLNDGALCGYLGYEWMNIAGTARRSSYVAFLKPLLSVGNVTLLNGAQVEKVVLTGGQATAVQFRHQGVQKTATVRREIILCAGALETPKLLMLSGIGPKAELARHGLPLHVDLPGVGQNLQDHPNVSLFFKGKQESDCSWAQLYGFHRVATRSHLQAGQADTCYVFYSARSSFREGVIRLLPLMMLPLLLYKVATLVRLLRALIKAVFSVGLLQRFVARMWGVVVILGKPKSRGRLWLQSTDPAQQAAIDPNYFGDPEDLETLLNGVQRAQQLAATEAMQKWGNKALIPGGGTRSRKALAKWVRKNVMTTYHYAGTCKMGLAEDPLAVVDVQLRVRGVRGLRVADASVIPSVPVSAMNAPSMVIGYRAAQLVKQAQQTSEEEAA